MLPGSLNLFSELDTADDSQPDERFPRHAGVDGQVKYCAALLDTPLAGVKNSWDAYRSPNRRSHGARGTEGAL